MSQNERNTSDIFIIAKMMDGDVDAFRHFFDSYYSDLCNFLNLYVKNQDVAEELVQDIFVHFWVNKNNLKINNSVKSYLYSAAKYKGLNHIRNTKRREEIIAQFDPNPATEISFDLFDQNILKDIITAATESLPPKCLQIFRMSQNSQLSNKEIADELGISVKTVENQMTIAFKKLRTTLQPYKDQLLTLMIFPLIN